MLERSSFSDSDVHAKLNDLRRAVIEGRAALGHLRPGLVALARFDPLDDSPRNRAAHLVAWIDYFRAELGPELARALDQILPPEPFGNPEPGRSEDAERELAS